MANDTINLANYKQLQERFQYLFDDELIRKICEVSTIRKFPAESVIMEIGQTITHMPIIVNGSIKIMTEDDNGEELLLYYLELGDTCAMTLNCCSRETKSAITAITEEDSELLMIPVEKMDQWMVEFKSWRTFVLESYNTRLNEMLSAIDNLAFNDMEHRLTKYLRDRAMVMHDGRLKITHYQIANDLHSSRVVISRLMKKLEKNNIIRQHRNQVEVIEFQEK
ncbi:MAG: Crp/Fnr family transcriptional regulator [Bacteroidia bacterium]|nr:Crp/Fnr family transcriptional regulator [Bacteroidia bacterium]NNC85048.1 Crp/Fnr family transcriptional regulator [Bacteroidia bacterium]NNM16654.1 Crp/Fnr family transcriptional regulator [Bacteroidia bacterium]